MLEKGEREALQTAVTSLQTSFCDGPVVTSSQPAAPARQSDVPPIALSQELLDIGDVERVTQVTALMDLDPQLYFKQAPTGEA